MTIDCSAAQLLGESVYARVFKIDGMAYKLFRRLPDRPAQDEERTRTFRAEVHAYQRVQQNPVLLKYTPPFHGTAHIDEVLDESGKSTGENYFLDCCYIMDAVEGTSQKPTLDMWNVDTRICDIREEFIAAGIYVDDADVFNIDDPQQIKIIDFRIILSKDEQ